MCAVYSVVRYQINKRRSLKTNLPRILEGMMISHDSVRKCIPAVQIDPISASDKHLERHFNVYYPSSFLPAGDVMLMRFEFIKFDSKSQLYKIMRL